MNLRFVAQGVLLAGLAVNAEAQAPSLDDARISILSIAAKASDKEVAFKPMDQDSVMALIPPGPCGTVRRMAPRQFGFNTGRQSDDTILYPTWSLAIGAAREHCVAAFAQMKADRQAALEIDAWQAKRTGEAVARQRNASYPPIPLYMPDPEWPDAGRLQKVEGTVLVHLVIGTTGKPEQLRILKTNLHSPLMKTISPSMIASFNISAMEAASSYRFKPSMKDGSIAASEMNVEVSFQNLSSASE